MDFSETTFVRIEGTTVHIETKSYDEAKLALKELKLKKKEYQLLKKTVSSEQKQIRATYTHDVRSRGSMVRGGGGLGKFVRLFQSASRDIKRAQLAEVLAPLETNKQITEAIIHSLDAAILKVEAHLLKNK